MVSAHTAHCASVDTVDSSAHNPVSAVCQNLPCHTSSPHYTTRAVNEHLRKVSQRLEKALGMLVRRDHNLCLGGLVNKDP